ncbi:BMA-CEH-53 [Dirofilaria immitis]|nr:BMA-CEH-53 [Dirofilaria immitis]
MAVYQKQQSEQQQPLLLSTTITNCNIAFEKSYYSREPTLPDLLHLNFILEDARNSKLPRRRTAFTDEQLSQLENAFQKCQYPKIDARMKLALETQLPEMRIQLELAAVDDDIYRSMVQESTSKISKKLRNIANPEIAPNTFVPKFNAVITWRPNDAFIFVTSAREVVACNNHSSSNMIANCL